MAAKSSSNSSAERSPESDRPIVVALAGNPNAGKSTIFSRLTGTRQTVGNYPGVTVEKLHGEFRLEGRAVQVVDLPGTYSLSAMSLDELVARKFVLEEHPDVVVSVVDASNLERNLYLTVQFMELGVPLIVVLNKSDLAAAGGIALDTEKLAALLRVRVLETVGHEGRGLEALKTAILEAAAHPRARPATVHYGREIEAEIARLLQPAEAVAGRLRRDARWLAVKLIESDAHVLRRLEELGDEGRVLAAAAAESVERISRHFGDSAEIVVADQRYGFISGACQEAVRITAQVRHSVSDRIDEVVTSRLVGIPIFLGMMYVLFTLTFRLSEWPMRWIEQAFGGLSALLALAWPAGVADTLRSLVLDGVIAGVGGVVTFLPNIALLFAGIAFLEDSGYMARGAFIMDRLMHKIGLHGRSFIPAMIGFGCTVPAILATRTLESRRDRLTTMLVLPLISCSARFPIYTLFIAALFPPAWRGRMLFGIYLVGIAMAALLAKLLRSTMLKGDSALFVMELPPYRMPTVRAILAHTWERSRLFLRKAGTVIVAASVVLWVLVSFPRPAADRLAGLSRPAQRALMLETSAAGRIGRALEPVMRHVGFDWRTTTALLGAVAAKEIFVAQLGIVHALGDADGTSATLRDTLRKAYTPLQGLCIMLFCLISVPCVGTIAATRAESGRWRYAVLQFVGLTLIAYLVTFVVYQLGALLSLGTG